MTYSGADAFGRLLSGLFIGAAAVFLLLLLASLLTYVIQSAALYRMAKNAGMPSPILAWVPVANCYVLGLLCERAGFRRSGKAWKFSVLLPVLELLSILGGSSLWFRSAGPWSADISLSFSPGNLLGLAGVVVTAIALYNLYWDYAQGQEVLYTVLSVILGGLGQAVILFILRNRVPISVQYPQNPQYPQYPQYPPYPQDPRGPKDKNL